MLAERYLEIGQPDRALEVLEQAGAGPDDVYAWRLRARALHDLERWEDAAHVARQVLAEDPDDVHVLSVLSSAEEQRGDLAAAEEAILAALRLEPGDAFLLSQYADVVMRGGQLDKAEQLLDAASHAEPESTAVLRSRIALAYVRGDDRGAEALTRRLLELDPEDVHGHRLLGSLELADARPQDAQERFATVLRDNPADDAVAERALAARLLAKPQYLPVRLFAKVGPAQSWIVAMVVLGALRSTGATVLAAIAGGLWLLVCLWSWIAGAALERKLKRA